MAPAKRRVLTRWFGIWGSWAHEALHSVRRRKVEHADFTDLRNAEASTSGVRPSHSPGGNLTDCRHRRANLSWPTGHADARFRRRLVGIAYGGGDGGPGWQRLTGRQHPTR